MEIDHARTLVQIALRMPEVSESTSCNKVAIKAGNTSFCFVGCKADRYDLMVKLGDTLAEATALAVDDARISVGRHGWVTVKLGANETIPSARAERWITESFRLLAPKALVRRLDAE